MDNPTDKRSKNRDGSRTPPRSRPDATPAASRPPETEWFSRGSRSRAMIGIFNIFLKADSAAERAETEMQAARIALMSTYLKFVIQSLCYLLALYVVYYALATIFSFSMMVLVPLTILGAMQLAAGSMHRTEDGTFEHSAHEKMQHSFTDNMTWLASRGTSVIDTLSDYAVGFFKSNCTESMKNVTIFDNQIARSNNI